ncbi:nucleotide-binding protein [Paenibacillus sp. YYML68]|uniref:nucleotide-binding protein n=1 Tax=Paenibacillus sp. YYML68 TaxID=2909250 RepID=UPI0024926670|nr:nucleotide-binding protein [Paenibacillus sp. YYML68]
MTKPKLFIGSSREAIKLVNALHRLLGYYAEVTPWHAGVFEANNSAMDDLETCLRTSDFAVFVCSPDDVVFMRDKVYLAPRDNTLFEMGLFWGRLQRERVFYLVPEKTETHKYNKKVDQFHIPSDLQGLTVLRYESRSDGNLTAAVNVACDEIISRIEKLGAFEDPRHQLQQATELLEQRQALLHFFVELHKKSISGEEEPYTSLYEAFRNAYSAAALAGFKVTGAAIWKAEGASGIRQVAGNVGRGSFYAFDALGAHGAGDDQATRLFVVEAYLNRKTQVCLYGQHVATVYLLCYPIGKELVFTVYLSGTKPVTDDDLRRLENDNRELMSTIHYLYGGESDG